MKKSLCFVALAIFAGCSSLPDTSSNTDGDTHDLRRAPDLGTDGSSIDLETPGDLQAPPDLLHASDLALPDLAPRPDLTALPDLTPPSDLTMSPDLTAPNLPDLAVSPDLTPPMIPTDMTLIADLSVPTDLTPGPDLLVAADMAPVVNLGSGLAGWWKLDETTGTTAADSSGNGDDGTLINFPGDDSEKISGKVGNAMMFDGASEYVSVPSPTSGVLDFGTASFSYSLWVYPVSGGSQESPLWKMGDTGTPGYNIGVVYGTGGNLMSATIGDGVTEGTLYFGTQSLLDRWTLMTVVVDRQAQTMTGFVDAVQTAQIGISGVGSVSTNQPLQLGLGSNWLPYKGGVDDVRIYNRALNTAEVGALLALGAGRKTLTVFTSGTGVGSVAGGSIACGNSCAQTIDSGSSITLTATPEGSSYFAGWSLSQCPGTGPCTVVVDADISVTAKFRDPVEESKVIMAASCATADVQAAIDAAKAGNTIMMPAGECTWGANSSYINVDKAITLAGSGRGVTTIDIDPTAAPYTNGTVLISAPATVSSFTIKTPATGVGNSGTAFSTSGNANGFRVTDIEYIGQTTTTNGYFLYTESYGLIDNCAITGGSGEYELIFVRGPLDSWQTPSSIGQADNLFVEGCTFSGPGYVTDCNSNSRCVVRFNTVTGAMKIDAHGKASNTPPRGVRHMEVYGNHWTAPGAFWAAIELRGGTGRVFSNTADTAGPLFFLTDYAATAAWPNFGNVIQTDADYPIDDQIGVGEDPKSGGSEPMYVWLNRAGGTEWPIELAYNPPSYMPLLIAADRDYFNEAQPFDGSSGVGAGLLADRPTTCATGTGYWATDMGEWNGRQSGPDGQLYRCTSPNTWSLFYVPYPYPYPLQ